MKAARVSGSPLHGVSGVLAFVEHAAHQPGREFGMSAVRSRDANTLTRAPQPTGVRGTLDGRERERRIRPRGFAQRNGAATTTITRVG